MLHLSSSYFAIRIFSGALSSLARALGKEHFAKLSRLYTRFAPHFVSFRFSAITELILSRRLRVRHTHTCSSVNRPRTRTILRRKCCVQEWQSFMEPLSCQTSTLDCQ